jgi:hypothetical protein
MMSAQHVRVGASMVLSVVTSTIPLYFIAITLSAVETLQINRRGLAVAPYPSHLNQFETLNGKGRHHLLDAA